MAQIAPGQAKFLRLPNPEGIPRVALLLCDDIERVPQGRCAVKLRSQVFLEENDAQTVAVAVVMVRLLVEGEERFYTAWIDELAPTGDEVLEALANQQELTVWFSPPDRRGAVSTRIPNVLRAVAQRHWRTVLAVANAAPWGLEDFALCRSRLESQYPTANSLWERLKGHP